MINLKKTLRSFRYAAEGLWGLFVYENNARFHLLAALAVSIAGWFFELNPTEWALIVIAIGGVWSAEAFNTALEKLCDMVQPEQDPRIKIIKDLAAAGVLITAGVAFIIALLIFGERLLQLLIYR